VGACLACGGIDTLLASGAWFGVGERSVAVGLHICDVDGMLASGFCEMTDFLLTSSASGLGLRLRSGGCVVGSGAFVRLSVASCSNARRLVEVSVVVVVILRTCDACDPALLSLEVFRSRSVAALAGRDCCWRRAAEARRSATEAPREGWLEAIVCLVHSRSVLLYERCCCYSAGVSGMVYRV
jgi:hypothetical protein